MYMYLCVARLEPVMLLWLPVLLITQALIYKGQAQENHHMHKACIW